MIAGNPCLLTVLSLWQSKLENLIASGVGECASSGSSRNTRAEEPETRHSSMASLQLMKNIALGLKLLTFFLDSLHFYQIIPVRMLL